MRGITMVHSRKCSLAYHVRYSIQNGVYMPTIGASHRPFFDVHLIYEVKCIVRLETRKNAPPIGHDVMTWGTRHQPSLESQRAMKCPPTCPRRHELETLDQSCIPPTCFAASTKAPHSIFGMNPLKKSALNSAERNSIWASFIWSGKLLDVHPFAWQARRLWVMRRTIVMVDGEWW